MVQHHVLAAGQPGVTQPAGEVLRVPGLTLRLDKLVREDELVTSATPGDAHLGGEVSV